MSARSGPRSSRSQQMSARQAGLKNNGTIVLSARSVPERDFVTTNALIGLSNFHPEIKRTVAESNPAGLGRVEAAYHDHSFLFPRFERQKMKGWYDNNAIEGDKVPVRKYLQDIPCKLKPREPVPEPEFCPASARSVSTGIMESARSYASTSVSYAPGWVHQHRRDPDFYKRRYMTHNSFYGKDCNFDPYAKANEPGRGRELWMHTTKQHPSWDNCLTTNHLYVPRLRSAR